ncbi:ParB/RepB/Spo0J family partition protein [Paracoccus sp. YIM 132242]|uniref:ParB/RepB/Spo0J family partition protein n=1 Tax=Paracoccus lichenicola TaxID=2665644 RepID=A0A6L6HU97_9RHOB|nr:ParB/RepB/Spo0J family partition protein [Paracoccus lichenicola]MTE01675.1 ParB/RepB/Spo0J family partition protein [Paracoccus lichenicola]
MSNVTPFTRETRTIDTPAVESIPLADLYLSDMNPRQEADPEGIALLADSIAMIGLIQPIAGVRDEIGKIGIVAGGRRWRAIKLVFERDPALADIRPDLARVPVRLAPDEATARAWAAVENTAREDLHPADEIRAFDRMREGGADVPTIARTFGITEAHVYRRLALAALPAPVLDALKAGEITLGAAKAFTIADDEALALSVLDRIRGNEVSEHRLKQILQPEAINAGSDRRARFVGIDAYRAAGGRISADLFADATLLHDTDLLDRLFAEKLEAEADVKEAEWAWIVTLAESYVPYGTVEKMARLYRVEGDLTEEQAERYDELAELAEAEVLDEDGQAELEALQAILDGDFTDEQRRFGGWFMCVAQDGQIRMDGPYVRPEDRTAAIEAGVLTGHAAQPIESGKEDAPKSPYSGALVADLQAMRSAAVQGAMLDKPELALDLLAYTFAQAWGGPLAVRTDETPIKPATETGFAPDPRLLGGAHEGEGEDTASEADPFDAFRAKGKKHRNAVLALILARSLKYSDRDPIFARVEAETKAHVRQVWTPTAENFFSRVSAGYLDALHLDLTGCNPQGNGFKAFKSQKKREKAAGMERLFTDADYQAAWKIDAEKKARINAWVPDCF